MKRTTIYLEPELHRALKLRAAETDQSVSALVNRAVETSVAEDLDDILAMKNRAGGTTETYAEFLTGLRADGAI